MITSHMRSSVIGIVFSILLVQSSVPLNAHEQTTQSDFLAQPAPSTQPQAATPSFFDFDDFDEPEEPMTRWERFKDTMGTVRLALNMLARQKSRQFSEWWYNGGREKTLLAVLTASAAGTGFGMGYYVGKQKPKEKKKQSEESDEQ